MPVQTVIDPVSAGANVVGSAFSFFGGKGAQRAQERAAAEALRYERERDQYEREQERLRREEEERRWWAEWDAGAGQRAARASILSKYGINTPLPQGPPPRPYAGGAESAGTGAGGAIPPGGASSATGPAIPKRPLPPGYERLAGSGGDTGQSRSPYNLARLVNWNEWS